MADFEEEVEVFEDDLEETDYQTCQDNVIEWLKGKKVATVTFCRGRFANRILSLAETHPEEVEIVAVNKDGSVTAHIPVRYVKISAPRVMTDEQKAIAGERLRKFRDKI